MTPNQGKRKYDVTIVETNVHTFTVEVAEGDDPYEVAEQVYLDTDPSELENHNWFIPDREVESATPQPV